MTETNALADLSYVDAVAELDAIVRELDQGVVNVDVLGVQFQRAIDIIEELNRRIQKTRGDVDVLSARLDALSSGQTDADSE